MIQTEGAPPGLMRATWSPTSDSLLSLTAVGTESAVGTMDGFPADPSIQMASLSPELTDQTGDGVRPASSTSLAAVGNHRSSGSGQGLDGVRRQRLVDYISRWYRVPQENVGRYLTDAVGAAREFRLDPMLVIGIMAVESSFNPKAQSSVGAQGLMQVHTRVHKEKFTRHGGSRAAYDPKANVRVGTQILSGYLQRYGSTEAALKAYVGAAFMRHDGGYGRKVTGMRDRFAAVADGRLGLKAPAWGATPTEPAPGRARATVAAAPAPAVSHGAHSKSGRHVRTAAAISTAGARSGASAARRAVSSAPASAPASDKALRRLAQDASARNRARLVAQHEASRRRM